MVPVYDFYEKNEFAFIEKRSEDFTQIFLI